MSLAPGAEGLRHLAYCRAVAGEVIEQVQVGLLTKQA